MFAVIDVKQATHIVIHIPLEGADKSLPALCGLFERNAVFIQEGYQEINVVKPEISVKLGDVYKHKNADFAIEIIPNSQMVSDENFVLASPEVFVSNTEFVKKSRERESKLNTEISYLKQQLAYAQERVTFLEAQIKEAGE